MKKTIRAFFGLSLTLTLAVPALAAAQQTDPALAAQAQALLQQVAQLQAQLAAQNGGVSTNVNVSVPPPQAGSVNSAACPNIGRVLKKGSTGDDVTRLQRFLAQDPSLYPEGTVSGYYGALTEKAVQRWQVKFNIVSSGTAASTGYGVVGPRTAAAIALLCSTSGGSTSPVGGYIQVSPISGNAPLNVNVIATVNSTNSCAGAIYQLNWGDNSSPISIPVAANNCQPVSQTYQHTYLSGGVYQIVLSSGAHQTGATVTVNGNSTGGGTPAQGETFTGTPTSGNAPLTVTFSGIVNGTDQGWCANGCSDILIFGDNSQGAVPLPTSQTQAQSFSLQHTYVNGGTYVATLYQGQAGNGRPTVGVPVTITAAGGGGGTTSALNPPSVSPGVGGDPFTVQVQFDLPYNQCSNYAISWGDGSNTTPPTTSCNGSTSLTTFTQNHTYSASGQYTITLTRGSRTDTAGVNISN